MTNKICPILTGPLKPASIIGAQEQSGAISCQGSRCALFVPINGGPDGACCFTLLPAGLQALTGVAAALLPPVNSDLGPTPH